MISLSLLQGKLARRHGQIVAAVLVAFTLPTSAQPCNPVIDGTYCATLPPSARTSDPARTRPTMSPIQEIGSATFGNPNDVGTFGGISFRGGTTCIGLMRRGNCN